MDYNSLKELIKAVSESQLTSFQVEENGLAIKMSKEVKVMQPTLDHSNIERSVSKIEEEVICDKREIINVEEQNVHIDMKDYGEIEIVVSPIVGTFYSSPGPNEKVFIKKGDKVKKGDTLCIVEAMKLMNEITSDIEGTVVEILAENEDMVEYGQPIIKIRKD